MDNQEFDIFNKPCDSVDWIETSQDFWSDKQPEILDMIKAMQWHYPKNQDNDGLWFLADAIKIRNAILIPDIVKGFNIQGLSAVSESSHFAPFEIIGVQSKKLDIYCRAYVLDCGLDTLSCICVECWTIGDLQRVKDALTRILAKRRQRGATPGDLISYLADCKEGAWKNCPDIIAFLDELINELVKENK